jgi:hypothetical protein
MDNTVRMIADATDVPRAGSVNDIDGRFVREMVVNAIHNPVFFAVDGKMSVDETADWEITRCL